MGILVLQFACASFVFRVLHSKSPGFLISILFAYRLGFTCLVCIPFRIPRGRPTWAHSLQLLPLCFLRSPALHSVSWDIPSNPTATSSTSMLLVPFYFLAHLVSLFDLGLYMLLGLTIVGIRAFPMHCAGMKRIVRAKRIPPGTRYVWRTPCACRPVLGCANAAVRLLSGYLAP